MKFDLMGLETLPDAERADVAEMIQRILKAADLDNFAINISLVDKDKMSELYLQFKKQKKVTDVLSFPVPDMEKIFPHSKNFLGDVVICVDQARRQAKQLGHSFAEEIGVLSAHGLFHLLGYDHEESADEADIQLQGEMYILEMAGLPVELSLIGRS